MSLEQSILDVLKKLPPLRQQEVLDFAQSLRAKVSAAPQPRKSLYGLLAETGPSVSAEDIDEARRELWGNFPREDIA